MKQIKMKPEIAHVARDWGSFQIITTRKQNDQTVYREKLLYINANSEIQLHKHVGYDESWISEQSFKYVLEDNTGKLDTYQASNNQKIFVSRGKKHKIITMDMPVIISEIQSGVIEDTDNLKYD